MTGVQTCALPISPTAPLSRRDIVHRPGAIIVRGRRRRLPALALAGAIIAAAGVISFILLNSAAKSQGPLTSPSAAKSASPTSSLPVTSPHFRPVLSGYDGNDISSLAFSPSGALAIADYPHQICLWDIATKRCTAKLASAWSVAFSPNGKLLASVDGDASGANIISLWNAATTQPTRIPLPNPKSPGAYSVAFSNEILAAADGNGTTYLWNVVTHKLIPPLAGPQGQPAMSVAFSRDGKLLAVGYENGSTYLWDVVTHKPVSLPGPQGESANSVAFSRDGKLLAVGYQNGSTYLWSVVAHKPVATLRDSSVRNVYTVAFSPDGRLLAVGDTNGSIHVLNVAARKWLAPLREPNSGAHPSGVDSVVFSPSSTILAAGYGNGSVYLWYISLRLSIVRITTPPLYGRVTLLMSGIAEQLRQAFLELPDAGGRRVRARRAGRGAGRGTCDRRQPHERCRRH